MDGEPTYSPGRFVALLGAADAEALHASGVRRRYPRATTLFLEGDRSDRVLVVISGRVKLVSLSADGRESILAIAGPGDLLGEIAAIDGHPRSATAIALEAVQVLVIPVEQFLSYLERTPAAATFLLRMLCSRLRDADRKRLEFGVYDTVGRVARRLVEMAGRFGEEEGAGGGVRITLTLSQEELAGWVGASREAVVKALRHLRDRGWIETRRREIRVIDLPALSRRAV